MRPPTASESAAVSLDAGAPVIVVFGSYSPASVDRLYRQAWRVGYELARAGYVVCNGGYDGTMEASSRGAKEAGGHTIGVTCDIFADYRGMPLKPNAWVDHEIPHSNLFKRIECMLALGSGFVVLQGGTGTLVEFAVVWEYVCKGLLQRRPIVVVGEFWRPVIETIRRVRPESAEYLTTVPGPEDVVAAIRAGLSPRKAGEARIV